MAVELLVEALPALFACSCRYNCCPEVEHEECYMGISAKARLIRGAGDLQRKRWTGLVRNLADNLVTHGARR